MKLSTGIEITTSHDLSSITIKVARWRMPVFIVQALREHRVPLKYWPVFFVRYYFFERRKS